MLCLDLLSKRTRPSWCRWDGQSRFVDLMILNSFDNYELINESIVVN